jgi:hypothetical protein
MRMASDPVLPLTDVARFADAAPARRFVPPQRRARGPESSRDRDGANLNGYSLQFILAHSGTSLEKRRWAGIGIFAKEVSMRNLLIAAVATAALAFTGAAGAQTGTTTNNNMNTGAKANMNMGGAAPAATNAQQPQTEKPKSHKQSSLQHRAAKHKMARKASSHRLAHKSSAKRLAHKGSTHRIAKKSTSRNVGLASGKVQQRKLQQAQQSKKRMPQRETTGTGSAGSMQNISPNTTPNMQK